MAADIDAAARGAFQSGDDAQERRLAASRRPEQNTKLAVGDGKRNLIQDPRVAEGFGYSVNGQRGDGILQGPCLAQRSATKIETNISPRGHTRLRRNQKDRNISRKTQRREVRSQKFRVKLGDLAREYPNRELPTLPEILRKLRKL